MNDDTTTLDQADEDSLTYTVSDEALEAAAAHSIWGVPPTANTALTPIGGPPCCR